MSMAKKVRDVVGKTLIEVLKAVPQIAVISCLIEGGKEIYDIFKEEGREKEKAEELMKVMGTKDEKEVKDKIISFYWKLEIPQTVVYMGGLILFTNSGHRIHEEEQEVIRVYIEECIEGTEGKLYEYMTDYDYQFVYDALVLNFDFIDDCPNYSEPSDIRELVVGFNDQMKEWGMGERYFNQYIVF